jgi:hypothetical protein
MGPEGAVVAWESFGGTFGSDTSRLSIQARRLDASGEFLDDNDVQINTYTNDDQRYPSATIAPNGFYGIAWQSYGSAGNDNSDYSVQFRAFDAGGVALDPADVQANSYTTNAQQFPAVALAQPAAVVAWEATAAAAEQTASRGAHGSSPRSARQWRSRRWPGCRGRAFYVLGRHST